VFVDLTGQTKERIHVGAQRQAASGSINMLAWVRRLRIDQGGIGMASKRRPVTFNAVKPPERVRLSDSIVSQIESMILDSTLKPGDPLPPEREFAERLRVSRPSLREALLKLEARALVRMRRGGGYSIADVTAPTLTDPLVHLLQRHPPAVLDVLELRVGIEAISAYLAAQRATPTDRALLKRRYAALARADKVRGDPVNDAEADLEFHMAVAEASHNVALIHVMRGLFNLLRTSILRFRNRVFELEDGSDRVLHAQHRSIYEAVMRGAADEAREAAHLHLAFIQATLRHGDRPSLIAAPATPVRRPASKRLTTGRVEKRKHS
jgi:GntR family transcriptional repressor for pyruvate dehydrogenase complex